ncbi:MAG: hypothetical protein ACW968_14535 [Candidatus Thorarchaeota archaeon]
MSNSEEPPEAFIDRIEARAYSRVTEIPERVESAILNISQALLRRYPYNNSVDYLTI